MKKSLRLALLVCASFVGLALAGPALATYTPSLAVEQSSYKLGAPFTADLFVLASPTDDPTAKLTIFSPQGYGVNLSHPPGTVLGRALASAQIAGVPIPLTGKVVVANPTDPKVTAASTICTGAPTNQAVLAVNLTIQGQTLPFLVFANKVGPIATFQICVPHPDNAPLGARVLWLDATIGKVFTNAAATNGYEWSTLFTPYNAQTKVPDPAATIEWRTYVGLPSRVTLSRAKTKRGIKLVGRLAVAGIKFVGGDPIKLNLYGGKKRNPAPSAMSFFGSGKRLARTSAVTAAGKYSVARRAVRFTTYFQTRFEGYGVSCDAPSPTGQAFPCKGEGIAAVTSNQVKVLKPKKQKRR